MRIGKLLFVAVSVLAIGLTAESLRAQTRVRQPTAPTVTGSGGSTANTNTSTSRAASFGQPSFDPYATTTVPPNAATIPPSLPGTVTTPPSTSPVFGATPAPTITTPPSTTTGAPSWPTWTDPNAPPTFPNTGYPAYPQQPSTLFPNGVAPAWTQNWNWPQPEEGRYMRLFQDIRLTHTWLYGGDNAPDEMGINETEVGTTVNFPNFLWSGHPIHVSPVFALHWWDGPQSPALPDGFPTDPPLIADPFAPPLFFVRPADGFGLPSRVYSAYLDFAWQPSITPQLSADLNVSVGVFSDFESVTSDSVRIQGTGLAVLALTPTVTLTGGIMYLDRVDLQFLPAGGILWIPNPQTRWDIFFPRPKVSRYLTTVGNTDMWGYLFGEYGGGSWTIGEQAVDRRMDYNDIRIGLGLQWTHQFGLRSFLEAAYVFERELVFAETNRVNEAGFLYPSTRDLNDTIMIRGGIVY